MPTTYNDQFFVMDPGNAPAGGTPLTVENFSFVDQNDDGLISTTAGDTFNGFTITSVWVGDTVTMNVPGVGNVTITGVTFYVAGGPAVFTPTDGTVLQNGTFVSSTFVNTSTQIPVGSFGPPCFVRGTLIDTPDGKRPIEDLRPGDLVLTRDHGAQPVLWISCKSFLATGRNAPVRICAGALGNEDDLWVSQQHRMLINDWRAELFFGEDEILVAAKHLVNGDTIYVQIGGEVEYFHMLFSQHEIVWGGGLPSESYFPGRFAETNSEETLREICEMFPELSPFGTEHQQAVRPVVTGRQAMVL